MGWLSFPDILNNLVASVVFWVIGVTLSYFLTESLRVQFLLSPAVIILVGIIIYSLVMFALNQSRAYAAWGRVGYDRWIPAQSSRAGLEEEIYRASHVWFASIAGAHISQLSCEARKKIDRVLLIEPDSEIMKILDGIQVHRGKRFPEEVREAVELCKSKQVREEREGSAIDVRLSSTPLLNVVLFDPGTSRAWARVQEFIPYHIGSESVVYAISRKKWGKLYKTIEDSFKQTWENGRDPN